MINYPDEWHAADLLAFSGRGAVSATIKLGTCSRISHIGGVAYVDRAALRESDKISEARIERWQDRFLLFEATTLSQFPCEITGEKIRGVQSIPPARRIHAYDGTVELFRLTPPYRERFEREGLGPVLTHEALRRIGAVYDGRGAIFAGTNWIARLHYWLFWRRVDRSTLFCNEYWGSLLAAVDLLPASNMSLSTPGSLFRRLVSSGVYAKHSDLKSEAMA